MKRCNHWWRRRHYSPGGKTCEPCELKRFRWAERELDALINSCDHDFEALRDIGGRTAKSCRNCPLIQLGPKP